MKFVILCFAFIIVDCFPSYSQGSVTYPLHIGDRWDYEVPSSSIQTTRVVTDTLMTNGRRYYGLYGGYAASPRFQRVESNKVFQYNTIIESEELLYDFSRSVGDTVVSLYRHSDTIDVVLIQYDTVTLWGIERPRWSFGFRFRHVMDGNENHVITDSIGLTRLEQAWGAYQLEGAILDGVEYGNITSVINQADKQLVDYKLEQNYPNPFNPLTTIRYFLAQRAQVSLRFDLPPEFRTERKESIFTQQKGPIWKNRSKNRREKHLIKSLNVVQCSSCWKGASEQAKLHVI